MSTKKILSTNKNLLTEEELENEDERIEIERSMYFLGKALYQYSLLMATKKNKNNSDSPL